MCKKITQFDISECDKGYEQIQNFTGLRSCYHFI
jgi:hypothetical protein